MEIKKMQTQCALAPTNISIADYVINPYRGCEFSCLYCYTQENKNIGKSKLTESLAIKTNIIEVLKNELSTKIVKRVLLGSTTECFQPCEKDFHLTEKIMQILNKKKIPFTILTKSSAIGDYTETIAANKNNKVFFTINFADEKTIRKIEQNSSPLSERIAAINTLINRGVSVRMHIGPFIPFLSDLIALINIIPAGISEINIELYHYKLGNFEKISAIEPRLKIIYASKKSYDTFCLQLKTDISSLATHGNLRFFFIAPDFDQFYQNSINYEIPLF
jgi:DNA repair photolyase